MENIKKIELQSALANEITSKSTKKKYLTNSTLFYEGQIPIVAYFITEGHVKLIKNGKVLKTLETGSLFGLSELLLSSASEYEAIAEPESSLHYLDKSTLKEISSLKNSLFYSFIDDKLKPKLNLKHPPE